MKPLLGLLAVLFLVIAVVPGQAQTPHLTPAAQSSVTPSDSNYKAHFPWNKECEERVAAMKGKPCDIIFIGDSITQNFVEEATPRWPLVGKTVWDKYYANRHALDFGVGADGTQHVLWRLDHMDIKGFKPKVAVILVGVNNHLNSTEEIADGVKAVVSKTEKLFPDAKIILVGILPSVIGGQKTADADKIIQTYADHQRVYYFDLGSKMTPVGNNWKGVGFDHLHLTPEGYELWASAMEPLLTQLLTSPFVSR